MNGESQKTCLHNGIRILTKEMNNVRSVCMGIWVNVGARDETHAEGGLSHFIEHMIFKGTKKRTGFQIAKEFDAIGGHTNAFTSMENTCYHGKIMDTHLETMVDILSDIFLNSVFDHQEIEKERSVILQEIGMVEDSPDEYVHLLLGKSYWGEHPLGRSILGAPENVLGFDNENLMDFFHRFYQPESIIISAAGNLSHEPFVEMIRKSFESISLQQKNGFPDRQPPPTIGTSSTDIQFRELEQVHFCLGLKGVSLTDPRRYAASLLTIILGGNMSSRLFQQIREKRGLAYSIYSFVSSYVDSGMFGIYGAVKPDRVIEATDLVLNEIKTLKKQLVTTTELQNAKEYTKGNLMLAAESNEHQMFRLAQNETLYGKYIPLQDIVDQIDRVTKKDIANLADQLFQTGQMSLTLLGPIQKQQAHEDLLTILN